MYRRAALLPLAAVIAFLLFPAAELTPQGQGQPANTPANVQSPTAPTIRLEHQVIEVPSPRMVKRAPRRRIPPVATRFASASPQPASTLVARTRRAVMGDGRYRPEPFPRLDR